MIIDFSKISTQLTSDNILNPRDIFTSLPSKKHGKFQYPRDIQSQVWEKWFERRDESRLLLKMNTGSGKTSVGLVILKSCLNEGKGPAVYVVPDNYLVKQVCDEAQDLGISVTTDPDSHRFISGKDILVITIHRLVNGKSVFGVGDEGIKINIGSLIIDDAHACVDTIEEQYTLRLSSLDQNTKPIYEKIYTEFKKDLLDQCESKALEIEAGDNSAYIQVPFWAWQQKIKQIKTVLIANKDQLKFSWPLIKENLELSRCVITSNTIEISPHCIPISMIPSFVNASRVIFMTATLVDDSILATHFGITQEHTFQAVIPNNIGDIGDRMILFPQVINPDFTDENIVALCAHTAKYFNVVVIVPSKFRANIWRGSANLVLDKENITEGVDQLKKGHVGLVVLINRYDGIDLPHDACRLLVIDGIPDARRLIDKVEQSILLGSDRVSDLIIQRIEQGMGRGVRASDDYCGIFLMGKSLVNQIYVGNAIDKFSPATKAQIQLSEQVSDQLMGNSLQDVWETILYCLQQKQDWVSASKGILTGLSIIPKETNKTNIALRQAYDLASRHDYSGACSILLELINDTKDKAFKSYLKQIAAEYYNFNDQNEAQQLLLSAAKDNTRVLMPIKGLQYQKLSKASSEQATACSQYLTSFKDANQAILKLNAVLNDLVFAEKSANRFEQAMAELALFIGFYSQRPENDYKKGPDVLWEMGGLKYLVIECKNEAITSTINKQYCNQLNGSGEWFINNYDQSCSFVPILIHPSNKFEYAATYRKGTRILNKDCLEKLKSSVDSFIRSIVTSNMMSNIQGIQVRLQQYKFLAENFESNYTIAPKK